MLRIREGKPGSGKSFVMAVYNIPYWLSRGRIVHTNIRVLPDAMLAWCYERWGVKFDPSSLVFWESGMELWRNFTTCCPKGIRGEPNHIVLDEAHKYANSRDWKENFRDFRNNLIFATEHRHFHLDLDFITQDANNVDAQFRRLTQYYYRYRDMSLLSIPMVGKIYPFKHTMEIVMDYDGKTKMGQNIVPRHQAGFKVYVSEAAQFDEDQSKSPFSPGQKRGTVVVDRKRQLIGSAERIGVTVAALGIVICLILSFF